MKGIEAVNIAHRQAAIVEAELIRIGAQHVTERVYTITTDKLTVDLDYQGQKLPIVVQPEKVDANSEAILKLKVYNFITEVRGTS